MAYTLLVPLYHKLLFNNRIQVWTEESKPPEKATTTLIGFSPDAIGSPSADNCNCRAVFSSAARTRVVMPRTAFFSEELFFDFGIFSVVEKRLVALF